MSEHPKFKKINPQKLVSYDIGAGKPASLDVG